MTASRRPPRARGKASLGKAPLGKAPLGLALLAPLALALGGCALLHRPAAPPPPAMAAAAKPMAAARPVDGKAGDAKPGDAKPGDAKPGDAKAGADAKPVADAKPMPDAKPAEPAKAAGADYVIGPGDQLSVFVYDSPQLGAEVPVRPDGRISTPLIQDIVAAGKTPSQLGAEMAERLREFIKDPHVTIILRGFVGPLDRQVRVIGEAAEPLALPYRDHLTVLDVMIASKGLTRYAAGNRAVIARRVRDKDGAERQESIPVRLSDLMKDGDISQNVEMQPGDTLIIPQSWF